MCGRGSGDGGVTSEVGRQSWLLLITLSICWGAATWLGRAMLKTHETSFMILDLPGGIDSLNRVGQRVSDSQLDVVELLVEPFKALLDTFKAMFEACDSSVEPLDIRLQLRLNTSKIVFGGNVCHPPVRWSQ
jgi:hypothetical protein